MQFIISIFGINRTKQKKSLNVYRTFHMKDTKFKHGDDYKLLKREHRQNQSSYESEATLDESNWYCSSYR